MTEWFAFVLALVSVAVVADASPDMVTSCIYDPGLAVVFATVSKKVSCSKFSFIYLSDSCTWARVAALRLQVAPLLQAHGVVLYAPTPAQQGFEAAATSGAPY